MVNKDSSKNSNSTVCMVYDAKYILMYYISLSYLQCMHQ